MEEDILIVPPTYKLFTERQIYIATIFGGPLIAGYLAAQNFKALGKVSGQRNSWILGIVGLIALVLIALFVPGVEKIPRVIIPLVTASIVYYLIKKVQSESINRHKAENGLFYSGWRVFWITLIGLAITFGILFLIIFSIYQYTGEIPGENVQ